MSVTRDTYDKTLITLLVVTLAACLWATNVPADEAKPLRVLLTNDDGYNSPGIMAVRESLLAAGHEVVLVAPMSNQSGSGMRVTISGMLDFSEASPGIWHVDGTPADAVLVALQQLMKDEPPDIIVSGANFGPNLGYASSSGTVGAATMAMYLGFPAIAVSVGVSASEADAEPVPFPSTFAAFAGAAELIVELLDDLRAARADYGDLLPAHALLNVNYPPAGPDAIQGVRVVPVSWDPGVRIQYVESEAGSQFQVQLSGADPGETDEEDLEWQWFARGYVTISVLDGKPDAPPFLRDAVSGRLSSIE